MRQVLLNNHFLKVQQVAQPLLEDNSVLVRVHYSCISSGTERATIVGAEQSYIQSMLTKTKKIIDALQEHGFAGTRALIDHKRYGNIQVLGYSCSGQVIAVGRNIHTLRIGDWVACAGSDYAVHAEYVVVPAQLVTRIYDQKNLRNASITTLGAIALQGIRRAHLQLGETVAIIGMGILGQLTLQLARQAGCNVIAIDIAAERLILGEQLGADKIFNAEQEDLSQQINAYTHFFWC